MIGATATACRRDAGVALAVVDDGDAPLSLFDVEPKWRRG